LICFQSDLAEQLQALTIKVAQTRSFQHRQLAKPRQPADRVTTRRARRQLVQLRCDEVDIGAKIGKLLRDLRFLGSQTVRLVLQPLLFSTLAFDLGFGFFGSDSRKQAFQLLLFMRDKGLILATSACSARMWRVFSSIGIGNLSSGYL
jgi:hypothetical protein